MGQLAQFCVLLMVFTILPTYVTSAPSFTKPSTNGQTFTIDEGKAINTQVTDMAVTSTGTVTWSISADASCTAAFALFPSASPATTTLLKTKILLDYETKNTYTCTISAVEGGVTVTRSIVINVNDLLDEEPTITIPAGDCSFAENVAAGTQCSASLTPTINDKDAADALTCSLSGTGSELFTVDPTSCRLKVKYKNDRDTMTATRFNNLIITVTDKAGKTAVATATATITDLNDNAPVCTPTSLEKSLNEETAAGFLLGFSCSDADDGTNAQMECSTEPATQPDFSAAMTTPLTLCRLSTKLKFNYDTMTTNTKQVIVVVKDKGTTPKSTSLTFTVTVLPINDNTPVWGTWSPGKPTTATTAIATVPENSPVGTNIFTVAATDADRGETVSYSIILVTGSLTAYFSMSGAVVSLARADLDRETTEYVDITVKASDGTNDISATVRVNVGKVNEFDPTFTPSSAYSVTVNEGTAANTDVLTMNVADPDKPASNVVCEIQSGNTAGVWQLKTGATKILQTKVNVVIDSPTSLATSYTLGVLCKDQGGTSPYRSAAATISINVNANSNDFDPVINMSPTTTATIKEDATTVDIATLTVTDKDGGAPGQTECSITSPVSSPFGLEGCLKVKRTGTLDYETTQSYDVVVRAQDKGTPPKFASVTLTVSVQNVDDNDPTCPSSPFTFTKSEAGSASISVGTVTCQDADNEGFTYSIVNTGLPFTIVSTSGAISTTAAGLDYDDKASAPYYQFDVRAVDKGSRGLSTTAQVTVTVTNVNEATPSFTNATYTTAENTAAGTLLTTFAATDSDGGADGQLVYTLKYTSNSGTGKFGVDASTGKVTLLSALDYELSGFSLKYYELTIEAADKGSPAKTGTGTLTVSVTDINDNTPIFATSTYSGTIAEKSADNSPVSGGPVSATDKDTGTFGTVHYTITAGNTGSFFKVHTTSGAVTTTANSLDYETTNSYTLTIKATDGAGTGPNTAVCNYIIAVTDVNEYPPTFAPNTAAISKPESTAVGALLYTASATDTDSGQTLTYTLDPAHASFTIGSKTGQIRLAQPLNFESTTSYSLTVKAVDSVTTFKTGQLALTVNVGDVNEFTPVCTPNPAVVTKDEETTGAVQTVSCTDGDATKTFVYSIVSVGGVLGSGKFSFSSNVLHLSTAIDYDTATGERSNKVIFTVSDSGPGTAKLVSVTTTVNILPVNEAAPVITSAAAASVKENTAVGTDIHTLTATDSDQGSNHGTITWSILSGNTQNYYKIVGNKLQVSIKPDREVQATATLRIRATDGPGRNAEQNLVITVTDINDNAPVFNPSSKVVNVVETSASGFVVDDFSATGRVTDADDGVSGNWELSIVSGAGGKFTLNGNRLEIATGTAPILKAATTNYYSMTIRATDKGTDPGPLSTDMNFIVNVLENNDVAPAFTSATAPISVPENRALGATIYDADATDTDGGLSGKVTFSLNSGDTYGNFLVNPSDGKVVIKAALDYEKPIKVHNLVIFAKDSGSPSKTGSMTLTVSVTDYNDNQPVFTSAITKTINENIGASQTVITATVTDNDSGVNADVTFSISSATGIFAINAATGALTTTANPDREARETYVLQLKAVDKGTPALTGYQTLTVTIGDLNDNTPTFSGAPFTYAVAEDATTNTLLTTASASDADKAGTANSQVTYSLFPADGTSDTSFFSIDASGNIKTAKALDRETTSYYQFHVLAKDGGSPVKTGTLAINVSVTDVNDNTPAITGSPYTATISEASGQGVLVQQITATDADIGLNAVLTYTVVGGDPSNQFTTTTDGKVVTAKSTGLDRETTPTYTLLVRVNDNGSPTKNSATATINLSLTDVNDNAPTFASNFARSVAELSPVDTNVGAVVTATDKDTGANAAISYVIVSQSPASGYFKIDASTGQVKTALATLDRETIAQFTLVVEARDNGAPSLTGTTTVTVTVTDVNDNTPVFTTNFTAGVNLAENTAVGTTILTVAATDADKAAHANSNVTYAIDPGRGQGSRANVLFSLGLKTGVLSVKVSPDYETDTAVGFYINATDQGTNKLFSSTYVLIRITDVNDNAPVFSQPFYDGELVYNDIYNSEILTVTATDADSGKNKEVRYNFVENAIYVVIDSITGRVTRATNHQATAGAKLIYIVMATDGGTPTKSAQVQIRVDVHNPEQTMVRITFSLTTTAFAAKSASILQALRSTLASRYPTCKVKLWRYEQKVVTNTVGRRLLANGVTAYYYVVADDRASSASNVASAKNFVSNNELLTYWRADAAGTPSAALRGTSFAGTPVVSVENYPQSATPAWYTTSWGIAVIVLSCLLFLLAVGVIAFFTVRLCKRRQSSPNRHMRLVTVSEHRPYNAVEPREKHPPPKFGVRDTPPPPYDSSRPNSNQVYRDPKVWTGNDSAPPPTVSSNVRSADYERAGSPPSQPPSRTRLIVTKNDQNNSGRSVTPVDIGF